MMSLSDKQKPKLTISQALCAAADGGNALTFACLLGYSSISLILMEKDENFEISAEQESWIGAAIPGMALIGSLIGGQLMEAFGRRFVIMAASLPSFLAWVCIAYSADAYQVIAARFLNGLCLGIQQVTMTVFISETIQSKLQPMVKIVPAITMMIGFLLMNVAGTMIGWRGMAWMGAASCLPLFLILFFLPPTPYFLLKSGKTREAIECLKWLRSTEKEAEEEFKDLQQSQSKSQSSVKFSDLIMPPYRWSFSIAILMHVFQQGTGVGVISTFLGLILERSGSLISVGPTSLAVTLINIASVFIMGKLISKYPSKTLIKFSSKLIVISLLTFSGYLWARERDGFLREVTKSLTLIPFLSITLFVIGFSLGWGGLPWMFIGTGLPLKIRGKGAGIVIAINWALNFTVTKTFSWTLLFLPSYGIFLIYAILTFSGQIIMTHYLPETFGLSDAQLEQYYKEAYKMKRN